MNAEKELLLALLIEKYTKQSDSKPNGIAVLKPTKRRRRKTLQIHKWQPSEKLAVLRQRDMGREWSEIAEDLGLTSNQVQNMHYSLTHRNAVIK